MNSRRRQLFSSFWLLLAAAMLLANPSSFYAQARKRASAAPAAPDESVEWERLLIKGEPQPTLRFPVVHQTAMSNCIGYLFITRDEIWYEVKGPAGHQDHAFRQPHASLKEARQWVLMRNHTNAVEYKFADGKTEHFFRVTDGAVETQSLMTWETPLSYGPMEQAVTNFDAVVRLAEERQRALAPKPIPTVSMNVEPATVEKGQPVTLTWTSSDATSLDLEPGIGPVPARGSKTIVPAESTTYLLTVQGPGGGSNASGHVTVNAPQMPPAIVLMDPSVSTSGQRIEARKSPLVVRGVVLDSSGLPVVTINGITAALRPKSAQAAEFASDPITLLPGDNRVEIKATSPTNVQATLTFIAQYAPPVAPTPAPPPNNRGLAKADILHLLQGDVPSARVVNLVRERGINFPASDDALNEIRAAGGDDDLIDAIRQAAQAAQH